MCLRWTVLTVLVDEHAEGDAVGVKAVEEVLDVTADERVEAEPLLVLDDSLSHGGNHVIMTVTDLDQELQETIHRKIKTNEHLEILPPSLNIEIFHMAQYRMDSLLTIYQYFT